MDEGEFTPHQLLLMELRDTFCDKNSAALARELNKDATYVNRLFYPKGKAGAKGIGLAIMKAANMAFFLPPGFWDREPPGLNEREIERIKGFRRKRYDQAGPLHHPPQASEPRPDDMQAIVGEAELQDIYAQLSERGRFALTQAARAVLATERPIDMPPTAPPAAPTAPGTQEPSRASPEWRKKSS